jgi:hypothetical protein
MSTVKNKLQHYFKTIEQNFHTLYNNREVKRVVSEMKKLRAKRTKQIEQMLNQPISEIKKSYKREVKSMEGFFKSEMEKTKKIFQNQLKELEKMKSTVEGHILKAKGGKPVRKTTKKAGTRTQAAKKKTTTKRTTTQKKATQTASGGSQS